MKNQNDNMVKYHPDEMAKIHNSKRESLHYEKELNDDEERCLQAAVYHMPVVSICTVKLKYGSVVRLDHMSVVAE